MKKPVLILGAALAFALRADLGPVPVIEFTLGDGVPGRGDHPVFTTEAMTCSTNGNVVSWFGAKHGGDAFVVRAVCLADGDSRSWSVSWSGWSDALYVEKVGVAAYVPRVGDADVLVPHGSGWLTSPKWGELKAKQSLQGGQTYAWKGQGVLNRGAKSWFFEVRDGRFQPIAFNTRVGHSVNEVKMLFTWDAPVSRADSAAHVLPFRAVLTPFEGGWFQAAEIYRRGIWPTDWYAKCRARDFGRLRDIGMWFWNRRTSDIVIPPVEKFQADAGVPAALDWYWWHAISYDTGYPNFWPPREGVESFRAAVRRLHEKGIYCQVYMNGMTWDVDDPSWTQGGEQGVKMLRDGTFRAHPWNRFTNHRLGYMCGEAPAYQARMRDQVKKLRESGLDGQYLDMIGNGGYGACWNTNHVHALGGGDHMVRNFRAYVEAVRADNPGMQFCTEDGNEAYMDLFESSIVLSPSYERTCGRAGEVMREVVPFFQAVYHRAVVMFGTFSMLDGIPAFDPLWPKEEMWKDEKAWEQMFPDQFQVEVSRGVVWGQQPCVHNFRLNNATDPRYAEGYRFMIDTARFYHENRDILFDGEMLDPGVLTCARQKVEFLQRATYTKAGEYKVAWHVLPTVFHSVWKSPDGRRSAVLVNWSRTSQDYALECPAGKAKGVLPPHGWIRLEF